MRVIRLFVGLFAVLAVLAIPAWRPAYAMTGTRTSLNVVFGSGRQAGVHPAEKAATTFFFSSALASTKSGLVSITVSTSGGSAPLLLSVGVGKQSFSFNLPAKDFTQSGNSATLNTHGDLKSYGSIQITWSQKSTTVPKGSCSNPTPGVTYVYFSNPKGSANLKLPCIGTVAAAFNGNYNGGSGGYVAVPSEGYYAGFVADASVSVASSTSVGLSAWKGSSSSTKPQFAAEVERTFSGGSAAPLTGHYQQFHATLAGGALQFDSAIGSATVNMSSGPTPFKGTKLSWTATTPPVKPSNDTCGGKWVGGGQRTATIAGTFSLQSCLLTGSYAVKTSATTYATLYSSTAKPVSKPALKLVSSSPASGATGVSTSLSSISLTYSNALSTQIDYALLSGSSPSDIQPLQNGTFSNGNKTQTFQITQPLSPNTTYTVQSTVMDIYQQNLSVKYQFKTGS